MPSPQKPIYQIYKDIFGASCDPETLEYNLNETWEIEGLITKSMLAASV